jgi:hypothetical protein
MRTLGADILVVSDRGFAALVEIKNVPELTAETAASYLRDVRSHGWAPEAEFLLVLSQDKAFLWRRNGHNGEIGSPTLEVSVKAVFDRYMEEAHVTGRLHGSELRILALNWLASLPGLDPKQYGELERELDQVGFISAIRNATITMETDR